MLRAMNLSREVFQASPFGAITDDHQMQFVTNLPQCFDGPDQVFDSFLPGQPADESGDKSVGGEIQFGS